MKITKQPLAPSSTDSSYTSLEQEETAASKELESQQSTDGFMQRENNNNALEEH